MKSDFNIKNAQEITLAEMLPGESAIVEEVLVEGPLGRRLMDLGLLPKTRIRVLRRSPLGDPTVYALRGYQLCLRTGDASMVRVRPAADLDAEAVSSPPAAPAPSAERWIRTSPGSA